MMRYRLIVISIFLTLSFTFAETRASVADLVARPPSYSVALGLNLRPRSYFSQEVYLQESWTASAGLHWRNCIILSDCLLRFGFEKPQDLPRNQKQIGVHVAESDLFVEAGIENSSLVPVGASFVVVRRSLRSSVEVGDFVTNDSSQSQWSELAIFSSVRGWIGVPLLPQQLGLNVGVQRFFTSSVQEKYQFGTELRFNFKLN